MILECKFNDDSQIFFTCLGIINAIVGINVIFVFGFGKQEVIPPCLYLYFLYVVCLHFFEVFK